MSIISKQFPLPPPTQRIYTSIISHTVSVSCVFLLIIGIGRCALTLLMALQHREMPIGTDPYRGTSPVLLHQREVGALTRNVAKDERYCKLSSCCDDVSIFPAWQWRWLAEGRVLWASLVKNALFNHSLDFYEPSLSHFSRSWFIIYIYVPLEVEYKRLHSLGILSFLIRLTRTKASLVL